MGLEDFKRFRKSRVQLFSRIRLMNIFSGEWESIYSGEGIEFDKTKPYEPEDEIRDLDLSTLIQTGEEEVVQRVVERQMRIYICIDFSGSMQRFDEMFFPQKPKIRDIAIGLLIFSALNSHSPVGLYAFNRENKIYFPARPGERWCWEILNWIIDQENRGYSAPLDIQNACTFFVERTLPQSLVFFVSDFQGHKFEGDMTALLRPMVKKFDFISVVIRDPLEKEALLKRSVRIIVKDSEGDKDAEIYLTPHKLKNMQNISAGHLLDLKKNLRMAGIEHVVLDSPSIKDCYETLSGFFQIRRRTRR